MRSHEEPAGGPRPGSPSLPTAQPACPNSLHARHAQGFMQAGWLLSCPPWTQVLPPLTDTQRELRKGHIGRKRRWGPYPHAGLLLASPPRHSLPTHLPKGLLSSEGRRPGPSCCPWNGPASERSGSVRFRGGVMTTPCRARRVNKFWELGVLGKSKAGMA